jgi:microcystin-dependent protein
MFVVNAMSKPKFNSILKQIGGQSQVQAAPCPTTSTTIVASTTAATNIATTTAAAITTSAATCTCNAASQQRNCVYFAAEACHAQNHQKQIHQPNACGSPHHPLCCMFLHPLSL